MIETTDDLKKQLDSMAADLRIIANYVLVHWKAERDKQRSEDAARAQEEHERVRAKFEAEHKLATEWEAGAAFGRKWREWWKKV